MIDWGLTAAVVAQITGGVTTTVVAVTATAAFLLRKRHRVRELRWLIRAQVRSFTQNTSILAPAGEALTADSIMALVREGEGLETLRTNALGVYQSVHQIYQMAEEYYFWGRVLRLGRRPEKL